MIQSYISVDQNGVALLYKVRAVSNQSYSRMGLSFAHCILTHLAEQANRFFEHLDHTLLKNKTKQKNNSSFLAKWFHNLAIKLLKDGWL